jgi:hypothetical protein
VLECLCGRRPWALRLCGSTFGAFGLEHADVGSSSEGDVFAFVPTGVEWVVGLRARDRASALAGRLYAR